MNMPFEKNQLLAHNTWGGCIALRPWNERETICLVGRTGQRHVLMNCFLRSAEDPKHPNHIIVIQDAEEVEAALLSAASAKSADKERSGS
jgi:hypothetical protein